MLEERIGAGFGIGHSQIVERAWNLAGPNFLDGHAFECFSRPKLDVHAQSGQALRFRPCR